MSKDEDIHHGKYDPHRLIFHMCLVGVSICALGMAATLYAFFQELGWGIFSLHVDALGDYLRSPLAFIYNVCLLLAGACFVLAMYGLHLVRYDRFTSLLALSGMLCGVTIMLLGVYPFNDQSAHHLVVIAFISSSMLMFGVLFLYRFARPQICPPLLGVISLVGFVSCLMVLWELEPNRQTSLCEDGKPCYLAMLMWTHTFATMLTGIGLAMMARRLIAATLD
ncbi:hypothetical protein L2725_01675 [Shewanella corallii]|uniref:DUF998 domain-containing protein n=1 Tax=Shewanella corallii TaxID=560080 RepID=A0ABT0N257_9GAMM|nr:hypothetical protein [Shewanella corallii]MCL2912503.1 hypothetical protein [Shewanella corallii]